MSRFCVSDREESVPSERGEESWTYFLPGENAYRTLTITRAESLRLQENAWRNRRLGLWQAAALRERRYQDFISNEAAYDLFVGCTVSRFLDNTAPHLDTILEFLRFPAWHQRLSRILLHHHNNIIPEDYPWYESIVVCRVGTTPFCQVIAGCVRNACVTASILV